MTTNQSLIDAACKAVFVTFVGDARKIDDNSYVCRVLCPGHKTETVLFYGSQRHALPQRMWHSVDLQIVTAFVNGPCGISMHRYGTGKCNNCGLAVVMMIDVKSRMYDKNDEVEVPTDRNGFPDDPNTWRFRTRRHPKDPQ